ncbi:MAG: radical SAM protein [Gloeocapsa sp. DLM2.Bin57]|nr:MAG: radical SAM protein [Gloeocapsa sp. DLM2.Bin57]
MTLLNIAEICTTTQTLGPGKRFVIWLQGCCFRCPQCVSPDWIPQKPAHLIDPVRLGELILSIPDLEGLTISGGEPMLQAKGLLELFTYLRQRRELSIICYSGFTLEQLCTKSSLAIDSILAMIDVLIDGQYIAELDDNLGLRGSSNQVVHFLSSHYISQVDMFTKGKRNVEIHLLGEQALLVGVPPQNFINQFHAIVGGEQVVHQKKD